MRIRRLKWSRDILLPVAFVLVAAWGIAGGSAQVAFLAGALSVVQILPILARIELRQSDGSYKGLVSDRWSAWSDRWRLVFVVLITVTIGVVSLLLL